MILVSGQSGADRTALISAALQGVPHLDYLTTYTTRPQRPGERPTHEYVFLDDAAYGARRAESDDWGHAEYNGHSYGVDVGAARRALAAGQHIICSIEPDGLVLGDLKRRYAVEPLTVWIGATPGSETLSRREDEFAHELFTYTFQPTGELEADCQEFSRRIVRLLSR